MAVTSYKVAGAGSWEARAGSDGPWEHPDRVTACDDSWASSDIGKNDYSDWLRCVSFGFTVVDIPAGATINGIEVKIQRHQGIATDVIDSALYLRKTAGQVGDNKASAVVWQETVDEEVTYGGAADTWNAGLVDTDVVSADFGVDLSALAGAVVSEGFIDCVSIRIYYTEAVGGIADKSANMGAKMIAGKLI